MTEAPARLWESIRSFFWASCTCVFSYLVASVVSDMPVLPIAISVVVTTALLGLLDGPLKRCWERTDVAETTERPASPDPSEAVIRSG